MDTSALTPALLLLLVGVALGALLGVLWSRRTTVGEATAALPAALDALERRAASDAVVRDGLRRIGAQMDALDRARSSHQGELRAQVEEMARSTEALRRETGALSTALRRPQVRGRWGELHLRRTVELAGLVDRCDFTEQVRLDDGTLRPDLVVRLAGGRSVVVDAKVALDAFLDAGEADDPEEVAAHLRRHARQLRTHVDSLSGKAYWRSLPESTDFVVLFVPAEAVLSAALETDRDLLEHAASRHVVLASPTTLIALLRTVAQGWRHQALSDQAAEVQRLGRELHERLATMSEHLDKVGRSLTSTVAAWNSAVGSLEGRVLVTARKFNDLGVTDDPLEGPRQVELMPREPVADELLPARRPRSA
ncbi:DNA recombination protein RmuC [uncultured Nocardioides sp.]|uniref:DNA recombination protein RmuC n=1 Tax=uncultured Nocardioides sp. TaxID=198441 RepID=UPI00261DEF04|nr:DNA recombination protein RmuC [uncultured Nocardioides sp.]